MKVAVVGATGLVGTVILKVLEERQFPVSELLPVASGRSVGRTVRFAGSEVPVVSAETALAAWPQIALFSAGAAVSRELAPRFAAIGCRVVDNSSCWRMDSSVPLVVPEINGDVLGASDMIVANPNCSTIQMLLPLAPLHRRWGIRRIVVSTYQSVSGTGYKALAQMEAERAGRQWGEYPAVYPHPIDLNILPHIDDFLDSGYTKEEMKMVNETHKILADPGIAVSPTTVREVRSVIASAPGCVLQDDPSAAVYPMPLYAQGRDEVFVGRIRRDPTVPYGLSLWCVADNLRKGAATNAVQIAQLLLPYAIA